MADITKLKAARGLGDPPTSEEARADLAHPPPAPHSPPPPPMVHPPVNRIDARSLRRSGRTVHFATKVTPEFDNRVRQLAMDRGKMLTEILEEALMAYEREIGGR